MSAVGTLAGKVGNRLARVRQHRWRTRPDISSDRAIVLGGSPRSGTTLLRRILDAHPSIVAGPETDLLIPARVVPARLALDYDLDADEIAGWLRRSSSQTRFVETFFGAVTARAGKRRWAEKTPLNVLHLDWILRHFPEARFVHVIRDGRDAAASMRRHPLRRLVDGRWVRVPQDRDLESTVRWWARLVEHGLAWRDDPRYLEVRYEELVADPEAQLQRVLEHLDEPFDARLLEGRVGEGRPEGVEEGSQGRAPDGELDARGAISTASVGRWRQDLGEAERAIVKRRANDLLMRLGYAVDDRW